MRSDRERLLDIQEAIERIEKYTADGKEAFEASDLIQTWVVHHLQIIGEAVRVLPDEFRQVHLEISWKQTVGMRHILVHNYFGTDTTIVWPVVGNDLPDLKVKTLKPSFKNQAFEQQKARI